MPCATCSIRVYVVPRSEVDSSMQLAQFATRRPVTTGMLLISMVVLGGVALARLPLLYLPTYDSPRLTITVPYPSSAPDETARLIVEPIEEVMGTVSRLDRITSQATSTEGRVRLEFHPDVDMDLVAVEVRDRLDRVRWRLPSDVRHIFLRRWSSTDIPVISMRLGWQGAAEDFDDIIDHTIQRRLQALDGVADVRVSGLQRKTLQIEINPVALETHGLTTFQLATLLRRNNLTMSGGTVEDGGVRYLLRSLGELQGADQIAQLPVNTQGLRLRDVARVRYDYPEKTQYDRLDKEDTVSLRVYRSTTANVVEVARSVRRTLEDIRALPGLEPLSVFVYHDSSETIVTRIHHLQWSGVLGSGLALGVLFLFLRHVRVTLVLGIAIPISVMATFLLMYVMREVFGSSLSLNLVSLSGLMLSVGMLVDNSIVVLENIFRHRLLGKAPGEASVLGAQEVSHAVLVSTATSVVVFLPTIFVSTGWTGRLMSEFGLVLCASLGASLIVALSAVPLLSTPLLARNVLSTASLQNRTSMLYGKAIAWTLRYRWVVIMLGAVVFGVSLYMFINVLLPNRDFLRTPQRRLHITVKTARTMPFTQVKATMEQLEDVVLSRREAFEVRHVVSAFGYDGKHSLTVYFHELDQSRTPTLTLQERLLAELPRLPGVEYQTERGQAVGGGQMGISVQLQGPSGEELARLSQVVKEYLRQIPGVYNVETDVERADDELHLAVDRELAQRLTLYPRRVAMTVAFAMSERPVTTVTLDHQEVDVTMHVGAERQFSTSQLDTLPVIPRSRGAAVHVGNLVNSRVQPAPTSVTLDNRLRTTTVEVNFQDRQSLRQIARQISWRMSRLSLPTGYSWQMGSSYRRFTESETESSFTLMVAIALIYMIMAALFESFVLPLAIMLTVPFALSGVVVVFGTTGTHLNQMADLGLLILCGLVVNNGIILVDTTNQLRAQGVSRTAALIQSGQQRLRPILMTVITTVAGLLPMVAPLFAPALFGPPERYVAIYGPIGLVVIGGLCTSTVLTLLLLPAVYTLLDDGSVAVRNVPRYLERV